jgi:hypothetical protein
MIFLFGGRFSPYIRTILGVALLVVGLTLHATALLLIGAALAIWGAATIVISLRGTR